MTKKMIEAVTKRIDSDVGSENAARQKENQKWLEDVGKAKHKKRRKLTKKRIAEIPNYDPEEIVGEFLTDEKGYHLMVRNKGGKLTDKYGRQVNRRGYLVDSKGNILTRGGIFIFREDELNDDDEVPAPFCLNKVTQ